jgi:hypothetical protein
MAAKISEEFGRNGQAFFYREEYIAPETIVENGIDLSSTYFRYIWVLDYIGGDILTSQPHNIGAEIEPQDLRAVAIKEQGTTTRSTTVAHSHFNRELSSNQYELKSARHLNNIRHLPEASFRQTEDIDMQLINNEITNFAPIPIFSGQYNGMRDRQSQWLIKGLVIDTTELEEDTIDTIDTSNIGLFATIEDATITGLSLFEGSVNANGSTNVGLIAGRMNGGTIRQSNSFSNIVVVGSAGNVGGLVGRLAEGGTIIHSFNAGFYNTLEIEGDNTHKTHSDTGVGSIRATSVNVGGLVGMNEGTIQDSFNNARVNIDNVSLTEDPEFISHTPINHPTPSTANAGGIAGTNALGGIIRNTYSTNHVSTASEATAGGIAGVNEGTINESFYIYNGCADDGGIYKEELRDLHNNPAFSAFEAGAVYEIGNNAYSSYPYPTLRNNNPFVSNELIWGWEDIQEAKRGSVELFYYERYDNGDWGFSTGGPPLVANTSPRLVVNDGYGLIFPVNRVGYRLMLNGIEYILSTGGVNYQSLTIRRATDGVDVLPLQWHVETFVNEEEVFFRLFIPNRIVEGSQTLSASLYLNASNDIGEAEPIGTINHSYPLFSIYGPSNIRSPRHLDNIDSSNARLEGSYTQQLNMDMDMYRRELNADGSLNDTTDLTFNQAVVLGEFAGSYDGNTRWIRNPRIYGTSDNVGLFSNIISGGSVTRITLRNPSVTGGNNVGTIAGVNNGSVTSSSVQLVVDQLVAVADHPIMVSGGNNVGGVVGNNQGTLTDVAVVSTSGQPSVAGTGTVVGGIAGANTGTVDRIQYLAIAPHFQTGNVITVQPFVGSGTVGNNSHYLSGTVALRPFTTMLLTSQQTTSQQSYNFVGERLTGAMNTVEMKNSTPFADWSRTTVSDALATSGTNTAFPYAYPGGTVRPDLIRGGGIIPMSNLLEWPIADDFEITREDGIVYFERYADGSYGVFTRRFNDNLDDPNIFVELDYLNPNGIIVEAGYGFNITALKEIGDLQGFRTAWASPNLGVRLVERDWTSLGNSIDISDDRTHFRVPNLDEDFAKIRSENISAYFNSNYGTKPLEPMNIWVNRSPGGGRIQREPLGVATINPLFAKAVYPIEYVSGSYGGVSTAAHFPTTHSIRTPWQMQNISRATSIDTSVDHTFILDGNLDFGIGTGMSGVSPTISNATANIVTGTFQYTFDGNGKTISNLNLSGTASNKGVFGTIGNDGVVQNLTLVNSSFQNGSNNGSFASTNYGRIQDVVFIYNNPTATVLPITGTGAGGIVANNRESGTIQNALFLGKAPGTTTNIYPIAYTNSGNASTNTYFLSGTVDATGKTIDFNIANANFGIGKTTQELNALTESILLREQFNEIWIPSRALITSNTMTSTIFPYPNVGATPTIPSSWPVATIPAERNEDKPVVTYFQIYEEGGIVFYDKDPDEEGGTVPPMDNDSEIIESGYAVIVPRAGGYSVKSGTFGSNYNIQAIRVLEEGQEEQEGQIGQETDIEYFVKLPASITIDYITTGQVYVNDINVGSVDVYVKPLPPEEEEEEEEDDGEIDNDGTTGEGLANHEVYIDAYMDDVQLGDDGNDTDDGLQLTITEEEIRERERIREELKEAHLLVFFEEYEDDWSDKPEDTFGFYVNKDLIPQEFLADINEIEALEREAEYLEIELEGMDYIRTDISLNRLRDINEIHETEETPLPESEDIIKDGKKTFETEEKLETKETLRSDKDIVKDKEIDKEIGKDIDKEINKDSYETSEIEETLRSEVEGIIRDGYGILSASEEIVVLVNHQEVEVETIPYGHIYLHIIPEMEEEGAVIHTISIMVEEQVIDLGQIRQDIIKGIYVMPEDEAARGWNKRFPFNTGRRALSEEDDKELLTS